MALSRPNTIRSLADAFNACKDGQPLWSVNLMGTVVDKLDPTKNEKTGDLQMTFTINDSTRLLKARFFGELPPIQSLGDIILIRNCKVLLTAIPILSGSDYSGQVMFIRNTSEILIGNEKKTTSTFVFQPDNLPREEAYMQSFYGGQNLPYLRQVPQGSHTTPSKDEQMYAIGLMRLSLPALVTAAASKATSLPDRPAASRTGGPPKVKANKLRLIQSVGYDQYCDLVVEVVKKFPDSYGNMELYVTDYTSNNLLYDYPAPNDADAEDDYNRDGDIYEYVSNVTGKRKNWSGPSGRHTLKIDLRPPHAGFARDKVKEGDFVMLSNVRIKKSNAGKMEGNLWEDGRYPDKVCVHQLRNGSEELKTLRNRRENYWAHLNKATLKRQLEEQAKEKSRNKAKKPKKKGKKAKTLDRDADRTASGSSAIANNKHVTCVGPEHDISTIGDIQSMIHSYKSRSGREFTTPLNVCYKVRTRVVDFWPPLLEDFARLVRIDQGSGDASDDGTGTISPSSQKWQWDFYLLLEDFKSHQSGQTPAQQWVHVDHMGAQYLLGIEEDATDLRHETQTLAQLREQMAVLWGNLEELKTDATAKHQPYPPDPLVVAEGMELSNLPFHCCIEEYGQELDEADIGSDEAFGYMTVYAIFGTRIFSGRRNE
ncbi:hypothetical protein E4T38_02358 [Aureobasidium subglaciale]|nr:hypothetical protein E4T38_02358 [Aureobasidium subglaciale]KAI5228564.1 hypothetical protein E4T40_02137 [Aureobasidium subglaciale]KAI5231920.1 hypothetical protein E4T41_02357 [Aureobasidium subglaciale]KAI5265786.1 hypothetical protein E4T46_02135 [Aureobasidium subglaciale]